MPWVKIDDKFPEHAKLAPVGPLGMALQVAGLCYCNRNLTDGYIPFSAAQQLLVWQFLGESTEQGRKLHTITHSCGMKGDYVTTDLVIDLLLRNGVWEPREGGYYIHDYEQYQPTKEEVLAEREAAKKRMKKHRKKVQKT